MLQSAEAQTAASVGDNVAPWVCQQTDTTSSFASILGSCKSHSLLHNQMKLTPCPDALAEDSSACTWDWVGR